MKTKQFSRFRSMVITTIKFLIKYHLSEIVENPLLRSPNRQFFHSLTRIIQKLCESKTMDDGKHIQFRVLLNCRHHLKCYQWAKSFVYYIIYLMNFLVTLSLSAESLTLRHFLSNNSNYWNQYIQPKQKRKKKKYQNTEGKLYIFRMER